MLIAMLFIVVYLNIVDCASWCISGAVQLATTVSYPTVATSVVAVPKRIPGSTNSDTTKTILQTVNVRLNVTLKRVLLTMAVENQ